MSITYCLVRFSCVFLILESLSPLLVCFVVYIAYIVYIVYGILSPACSSYINENVLRFCSYVLVVWYVYVALSVPTDIFRECHQLPFFLLGYLT
jgi:hypothetical protein